MYDFFIDKVLTNNEVVVGVSTLMNVPPGQICVAESSHGIPPCDEYEVLCRKTLKKGEFPMCLSLYHKLEFGYDEFIERIRHFCVQMNCSLLVSDEGTDPYVWLLIDNKGKKYLADIDVDKFDDDDLEIEVHHITPIF